MQSRRDAEIVKVKKQYLKTYLEEEQSAMAMARKRMAADSAQATLMPRKKFRRVSVELWRDACHSAKNTYADSLPTMEEASRLFGYTN